jgi:TM2 domain-containing membrane protein YozV
MNYYIAAGSVQQGPFTVEQLRSLGLRPDTLVWGEGMPQWQPANLVGELQPLLAMPGVPMQGSPIQYSAPAAMSISDAGSKKILAGIFAILMGGLGIHKFILGYVGAGLLMLLLTLLTCGLAGHIIGIIEGIIYLTKSDDEFYHTYIVGRRTWF